MDELKNYPDFEMVSRHLSVGAPDQNRKCWADPFAGRVANIGDVGLDGGVEIPNLGTDRDLDFFQVGTDQLEGKLIVVRRSGGEGGHGVPEGSHASGWGATRFHAWNEKES